MFGHLELNDNGGTIMDNEFKKGYEGMPDMQGQ